MERRRDGAAEFLDIWFFFGYGNKTKTLKANGRLPSNRVASTQ
jgi:hypothetical protein